MKAGRERRPQRPKQAPTALAKTLPEGPAKALVIVMGMPPALVGQVEAWITIALGRPVNVIPVAAGLDDNNPYRDAQVSTALDNVTEYARRKLRSECQPAPASILLLYVPGATHEPLLRAFDFFVFPIALVGLSAFDNGRQLRHRADEVERAVTNALDPASEMMATFSAVQQRIGALTHAEALQLPPSNFHLTDGERLAARFRRMRDGRQPWQAANDDLEPEVYDKARIPHLRPDVRRRAFRDARGLIFLRADLLALHGSNRELPGEGDEATALDLIRGSFRFGCPLLPGFHHDIQLEQDRSLKRLEFDCARRGCVVVGDTYVNIYPNDVVRGKNMTAC